VGITKTNMQIESQNRADSPEKKDFKSEFTDNLNSIEFRKDDLTKEVYSRLTGSKGFSLIKGEIAKKRDASAEVITQDQVDKYIRTQGGEGYLKEIFNRGKAGLLRDFNNTERKFADHIKLLTEEGRRGDNFRTSQFGQRLAKFVESAGGAGNAKFEDAIKSGLYEIKSDLNTIAEYGLTYFEYNNRTKRLNALKRMKVSALITEETSPSQTLDYRNGMRKDTTKVEVRSVAEGSGQLATKTDLSRVPQERKEPVRYFADEFSQERVDRILKSIRKPLQVEGVGTTEASAKIDSWKKILGKLAEAAFDVKDMFSAELAAYTEVAESKQVDGGYKVTMKVKDKELENLVKVYIRKKTMGAPVIRKKQD